MPNARREREPLFPYDHQLERTLHNINRNLGINDDDPNQNIPAPVDVHGQLLPDALGENKPLAVSICIRLLVTTKVWPVGRGGKTSSPSESAMLS